MAVVWLTPNPVSRVMKLPLYMQHEARGDRYSQTRDDRNAEREYSEMIRLRPDLPGGYLRHGNAAIRLGEYQNAIRDYTVGLRQHSTRLTRGHLLSNLVLAHLRAGQYPQAIARATEMLREHLGNPSKAYRMCGDAAGKASDYQNAAADLTRATELDPKEALNWVNRGWWEYKSDLLPQSIRSTCKALALKPDDPNASFNLGLCYAVTGQETDARRAFQGALKRSSEKSRTAAMKELEEALARYPASAELIHKALQWLRATPPSGPAPVGAPAT
jgi:tetratricopeptide (TPR) repeat protein